MHDLTSQINSVFCLSFPNYKEKEKLTLYFFFILAGLARRPLVQIGSRLLSSMTEALKTNGVIPDVIDEVPRDLLEVTYPNNKVEIGKILTPTQVKDQPTVTWNADAGALYTLCMTGM